MCTYTTERADMVGSGKGAQGWVDLDRATVYFDHSVHAQAGHTLNIDFTGPQAGPAGRVAVELTAQSAVRLVEAITAALAAVPDGLKQG